MKYPLFVIIVLFITSCSSVKQTVSTPEKNADQSKSKKNTVENETKIEEDIIVDSNSETNTDGALDQPMNEATGFDSELSKTSNSFDHSLWTNLLQKHVSPSGQVNYSGFKTDSKTLRAYIEALTQHKLTETNNRSEILAYWINAYNALTIDLIIRNYPLNSIKDIKDPWDQRLWKFGDKWLNLNHIEHNILRKMDEPRIHFAIVCASVSCPKLQNQAYTAEGLNAQLTQATKAFLSDSSKNQLSANDLNLSKIFKWFTKDFKTKNSDLIDFLNQYSDVDISENAKKNYLDYNWDLND